MFVRCQIKYCFSLLLILCCFQLFYEQNYEMATICFEKAKDTYWEGRSKASGLKAAADRISSSNLLEANVFLREAAKIFEAIGKADSAAKCFCDLGEYERAGVNLISS